MNSIADISVNTASGQAKSLSEYAGQVLLIVNVASYCGYTPQYKGLEQLNQQYRDRGLRILAFPSNDFGAQEPGTIAEIQAFCDRNYGVTFEIFDKVRAKGSQKHPLYARLTEAIAPSSEVSWNFEKFLVSKSGEVVGRYRSSVAPTSPELVEAIERELAK
ncbi:glutathione peroxidase [Microcoleus sp. FACHB-1515]|uniref:glutathione peroxidase n=1 Tax=Cyanophyceae TaxID=3028117 RepID=UPI0016844D19|nr:glutathione peroxidase [Microcoleus sp. FACHB-1515]MBD2088411.1 glutathione peroxidase [Microcoleus sp. FACHB-1515]